MEKFTGTNPGTNNKKEVNMENTISPNSGTNPGTNHNDSAQNETISRKLSTKERKRLSIEQTTLKQKIKKLARLKKEKVDLKKILKRGYDVKLILGENDGEKPQKKQLTISPADKLKIRDKLTAIDINLFDLREEMSKLSRNIVLKRGRSIQANRNTLLQKRWEKKQGKANSTPAMEQSQEAAETELQNTQSSNDEFDFMDERELVTVPLENKETKVSVNSDAEVIQE